MTAVPLRIDENNKKKNERIIAKDFETDAEDDYKKCLGVVYLITCEIDGKEHIIKIGSSRLTFEDRLKSYNCGYVSNWRTASTTNIKILQSFVVTIKDFNLYLYTKSGSQVYEWCGMKSEPFASSKIYAVENLFIGRFKEEFDKPPLANIQTNVKKRK